MELRESCRYIVDSPAGLVQYLAANLLPHGYYFYARMSIPPDKDALEVDRKLLWKYGADASRATNLVRKRQGVARVKYLRLGREIFLFATHGRHVIFAEEKLTDIRQKVLKVHGYSVGFRRGHPSVRISPERYKALKAELDLTAGKVRSTYVANGVLWGLPFEPYSGVRNQLFDLYRFVNKRRKARGLTPLLWNVCLRLRRRNHRVFAGAGPRGDLDGGE